MASVNIDDSVYRTLETTDEVYSENHRAVAYHEQENAGEGHQEAHVDIETRIYARNGKGENDNDIRCEEFVRS
jgi:hypothetical protein